MTPIKNSLIVTSPGTPLPFGAHLHGDGARFSIFSRHAEGVTLVLFHGEEPGDAFEEIELDPVINRTGDIWHIWVKGVREGRQYGYRISGPYDPSSGHRFNRNMLLIDPYARSLSKNTLWDLTKARGFDPDSPLLDLSISPADSGPYVPRCIVMPEHDRMYRGQLNIPMDHSVIYEVHLKGYTAHPSSGVGSPGTYAGIIEKIPYMKDLGVTAVELMPVQEFDAFENINVNPITGKRLTNYWGYSTIAFFAPKGLYSRARESGGQVAEFRDMVRAFHDAGIEVILDIVFNHTGEGNQLGPTVSFRGIDNSIYYILEEDRRFYKNFSGCGNTFNCNHPMVRDFILDVLRYWVIDMGIDGFRFDLASILGRDQEGAIQSNPPLIERIEEDPILRNTKIIAEAWDAAGAYQVGEFPGRWAEWNGKFRDDVRRFWRCDPDTVGSFATRVTGSSDLYGRDVLGPLQSINFITCHDGFTLNDLVSYSEKHNIDNGEDNRDGENHNLSQNFGVEGPTGIPYVERRRLRMIKNYIATLFLSQGIPMLLSGDEFRRTQGGNNNTYCQDNETSWIDWSLLQMNEELFRFTRGMVRFRKDHPVLRRKNFFTGETAPGKPGPDITWHGIKLNSPDWTQDSHAVAMLINGAYADDGEGGTDSDVFVIFNASNVGRFFDIPPSPSNRRWLLAVDTAGKTPGDIYEPGKEPVIDKAGYYAAKGSLVVLITGKG
ncbi:MAG TPA: glycogen debranching protein GlgX [Spirochaetota bacterium]|nr:glycogen debranching protein GlgX [Spirochaetota bacterium]